MEEEEEEKEEIEEEEGFKVEDEVLVVMKDGSTKQQGRLVRQHRDGSFAVVFADGERENGVPEARLERINIAALGVGEDGEDGEDECDRGGDFEVGDEVDAPWDGPGSKSYPAKVMRVFEDGDCALLFNDGDVLPKVANNTTSN